MICSREQQPEGFPIGRREVRTRRVVGVSWFDFHTETPRAVYVRVGDL